MGPIRLDSAADALKIAIGSKIFQAARARCRLNASRAALVLVALACHLALGVSIA